MPCPPEKYFGITSNNYKLSEGEIFVANFIPLATGDSLGSYFKAKNMNSATI